MGWLLTFIGLNGGRWNAFWSVIGDVPLIGIALGFYRHHNCHVHGCWRIGLRKVEGSEHIVCRTHHPAEYGRHLTPGDIKDQYCEAQDLLPVRQPGAAG